MTNEEYAAIVRSMIEHENALLNHRMTWMWTLQGLLAATAGIMWERHELLVILICSFGFISCISVGASLQSALRAIGSLLEDWEARLSAGGSHDGPRVIGSPTHRPVITRLYPWNMLPWLMAVVWVLLAVGRVVLGSGVA